jgi:hypothetical protein
MSDRLALSNAIEEAGIERGKAERLASVVFDTIHHNVATKTDIAALATKTDVRAVRLELPSVHSDLTALRDEMAQIERRLLTRLGGLIVVVAGVLFAALRHWPITGP